MAKKESKRAPTLTAEEVKLNDELAKVKDSNKERAKEIRAQLRRLAFKRLAPKRVRKALSALGNVEALGDYPVEAEEAEKIVSALHAAVDKVAEAFKPKAKAAAADFEL